MNFNHFIITRFNLRADPTRPPQSLDWLRNRFALFERFCYPSVRGQTKANFKWLVMFDEQTPIEFRDRVDSYARWPNFVPIFLPHSSIEFTRQIVRERITDNPKVVLTTRLDNDDAICRTFVEQLQAIPIPGEVTLFEYPVGLVWHKGKPYRDRQPSNPFSTLAEPIFNGDLSSLRTVYTGSHRDLAIRTPCRIISSGISWIQVIHPDNLSNHVRGIRINAANLSVQFSVDLCPAPICETRVGTSIDIVRSYVRTGFQRFREVIHKAFLSTHFSQRR